MRDKYEFGIFSKSKYTSNDPVILRRIMNSFTNAVKARKRLPLITIVLLEKDIIQAIKEKLENVKLEKVSISASLFGSWLEWLAEQISKLFTDVNKALPIKAKCNNAVIYWVAIPIHQRYEHDLRVQIAKFNHCMDSVIKLYDNMRIIKLKEGWSADNGNLVDRNSRFTHEGLDQYWESLDASVEYNFNK